MIISISRSPKDIKSINCEKVTDLSYTSSYRVTVEFNCFTSMGSETFCYKFYIKMSSEDEVRHSVALESRLMEREIGTYLRLVPKLQMSLNTINEDHFLPIPDIIYGSYQGSGEGIIVAMDLAEKGFSQLDISDDIILPTVVTVLQSLAKFHAISAAYISKVGLIQLQKEFPHVDGPIYNNDNIFQEVNKDLKVYKHSNAGLPNILIFVNLYSRTLSIDL